MLKRISLILLVAMFSLSSLQLKASEPPVEGMWFPLLISKNFKEMKRLGFKLTPEDIYSVNKSSLKDAIVSLGGFCTAEVISDQGLLLTNHHCAYDGIQSFSTVENDILTDGFAAKTLKDEKPIEGLKVYFLREVIPVTDTVLKEMEGIENEATRGQMVSSLNAHFTEKYGEDDKYRVDLEEFYYGNEYYVFIYETYKDVRLVLNPPEAVGKFGGDTDNWMWPRHTGDFSLLRVYADKDGNPAEYSEDNVPLKPKHHLPVNIKDKKKDDFSMIMGYPGRTERYLTSWDIAQKRDLMNPISVKVRGECLDVMRKRMDSSEKIRLQYASKYASLMNYYKLYGGQIESFNNLGTVESLEEYQDDFTTWVEKDDARKEKYGEVLSTLERTSKSKAPYMVPYQYLLEGLLYCSEGTRYAFGFIQAAPALEGYDEDDEESKAAVTEAFADITEGLDKHFKDYDQETDRQILATALQLYYDNVPKEYHPEVMEDFGKKGKEKFTEKLYKKSFLVTKEGVQDFLEDPSKKDLEKDPMFDLMSQFYQTFISKVVVYMQSIGGESKAAYRVYVQGMMEKAGDGELFYPDANSTMRLTYGTVLPYDPRDAVSYHWLTTHEGLVQKHKDNDPEFDVPDRLLELIEKKDFGQYANKDGDLPVCFLTDNDITGGNSGSPVINGNGELIGLAFDGNLEAAAGDFLFGGLNRTISVDSRYVLFLIDKYHNADRIIKEIDIVK